jgi:hypothetical protein
LGRKDLVGLQGRVGEYIGCCFSVLPGLVVRVPDELEMDVAFCIMNTLSTNLFCTQKLSDVPFFLSQRWR